MPRQTRKNAVPVGMMLSDIDNTLIGCTDGLAALEAWRRQNPQIVFGVNTGRSLEMALDVLIAEGVHAPDVMVTSVGSEIYQVSHDDYHVTRDDGWSQQIADGWEPEAIVAELADEPLLHRRAPIEHREFKRTWQARLRPADVAQIDARLAAAGLPATLIFSHGSYLDILPKRASKGQALAYLAEQHGLPVSATAAAGDSGNDRDLLLTAGLGILVGNYLPEIEDILDAPRVRVVEGHYANGIVEGLATWSPDADDLPRVA